MPQLTYINKRGNSAVINPLQAITYCLIGVLIISAVWVGQFVIDDPARLSGVMAGAELIRSIS